LTIKALKDIEFDGIFAFKYSPRPMTKASEMQEQISEEIKSYRLDEILKVQDKITDRKNRMLEEETQEILIEGESETNKEKLTGRTRTNKIVNIKKINIEVGTLLNVKITKSRKHSMEGTPIFHEG
jgi:tRNA-2-methylthio-N6-dimethylallyladenosine synthase